MRFLNVISLFLLGEMEDRFIAILMANFPNVCQPLKCQMYCCVAIGILIVNVLFDLRTS